MALQQTVHDVELYLTDAYTGLNKYTCLTCPGASTDLPAQNDRTVACATEQRKHDMEMSKRKNHSRDEGMQQQPECTGGKGKVPFDTYFLTHTF